MEAEWEGGMKIRYSESDSSVSNRMCYDAILGEYVAGFGHTRQDARLNLISHACMWCFAPEDEYDGCRWWRHEKREEYRATFDWLFMLDRSVVIRALESNAPPVGHPFPLTDDGYPVGLEM